MAPGDCQNMAQPTFSKHEVTVEIEVITCKKNMKALDKYR